MKKLTLLIILFIINYHYSQNKISPIYNAIYTLNYKMDLNDPKYVGTEDFILMIGKNESYYKSVNQFVLDSVKQNKAVYFGDNLNKAKVEMKYGTAMPENIYIHDDVIDVTTKVKGDYPYRYQEKKEMHWTLLNEKETINDLVCKKATINIFGRKWIAYYYEDVPFPVGPYKFNGLPGLIIKLYDTDKYFVYNLVALKKKKNKTYNIINYKNAIKVSKSQYFKEYRKIIDNVDNLGMLFKDADERKSYEKTMIDMNRSEGRKIEKENEYN